MKKHPNIIYILSDDQGYYSLGSMHRSELQTPALDRLAEQGTRFDAFYCASPVCSPARASIMTGTAPSCHGVQDWIRAGNIDPERMGISMEDRKIHDYLEETRPIDYLEGQLTYTDVLAENGYNCALCGKWHLGNSVEPQHGFSRWYTIGKGGCAYMDPDMVENGKITFPHKYVTHLISDKAVEMIGELAQEERPFYLSVNYTAPHSPWEAEHHPKEYLDLYDGCDYEKYFPTKPTHPWSSKWSRMKYTEENRHACYRGYEASITAMDAGIGHILEKLEKEGILEDTVVIFTGDNGFCMGQHGFFGKGNGTYPLNMYEESIRVPAIISWPAGGIPEKLHLKTTHSHYDLFPSILELAGIPYETTEKQPGRSFVGELTRGEENRDEAVTYDEYGATRMIRTGKYKYVHRYTDGPNELYDLEKDPGEAHNLYGDRAYDAVVVELRSRLTRWFNRYASVEKDGSREYVTGLGQMCKVGAEADRVNVFYPFDGE